MHRTRLDDAAIAKALAAHPAWHRDGEAIARTLQFADFRAAFAFMTEVARRAEAMQHHPDWRNCYARVEVRLWTHDAGGITARDFELATAIDRLAGGAVDPATAR